MFLFSRPDAARVAREFALAAQAAFNFEAGDATIDRPPAAYFRNETSTILGHGEACWRAARELRLTKLSWCEFLSEGAELGVGQVVMARVSHLGFWSLHPSRIVAVEREARRSSYTIRTLRRHDETGEEQFAVEWLASGEVRFAVRSYSRPAHLAGWLALPYVRHLQRRFGREAAHVMQSLG